MKYWFLRISGIITVLIVTSSIMSCEPPTEAETLGEIIGTVTNASNSQVIVGAQVKTEPTTSTKTTDAEGNFRFIDIEPGDYKVIASKTGLTEREVNIIVRAGAVSSADIQLTPKSVSITVSPLTLIFGAVNVGEPIIQSISITNPGTSNENLIGTLEIAGNGFIISSGAGAFSIEPGATHSVSIRFQPEAEQNYNGQLSIIHNATNETTPIVVQLSGTGDTAVSIDLSLSTTLISFGNILVDAVTQRSLIISNSSTSTSNLLGTLTLNGNGFSIVGESTSFSIVPGGTHEVVVQFSPVETQTYNGQLSINHNGTNISAPTSIPLSGTGEIAGSVTINVDNSSIAFGSVIIGNTPSQILQITNVASSTTNLTGTIALTGNGFNITSGNVAFTIAPGQSHTLILQFSPTAEQSYSGTISISHNATNESSPIIIPVSGMGEVETNIVISVSPSSHNYGNVNINDTSTRTVTIENASASTSPLMGSVSISGNGFSIVSGGGTFNLSAGQSTNLSVQFSPTSTQSYAGTVSLIHNATNVSSPINVSLSGVGISDVLINVSPSAVNFGTLSSASVSSLQQTITISNSGASTGVLSGNITISGISYSIISGGGNYQIEPGSSRYITINFAPTQPGNFNGILNVSHNGTNQSSPATINISGTRIAASVTLSSDDDTFVNSVLTTNSFAHYENILVGWSSVNGQTRSLIDFNISSSIPNGVNLVDATLFLTSWPNTVDPSTISVYVGMVAENWTGSSTNWTNKPQYLYYDSRTFTLQNNSSVSELDVGVEVNYMLNNSGDVESNFNEGFFLIPVSTSSPDHEMDFYSTEHATSTWHPRLVIEFVPVD